MSNKFKIFEETQKKINELTLGQQNALVKISEGHETDIGKIKNEIIASLRKDLSETKLAISTLTKAVKTFELELAKKERTIDLQDKRIYNLNLDMIKVNKVVDIISLVSPDKYKDIEDAGKSHIMAYLGNDDRSKLLYQNYVTSMWKSVRKECGVNSTKMIKVSDFQKALDTIKAWHPCVKYKNDLLKKLSNTSDRKQRGEELTSKEAKDVILYDRLQSKYNGDLIKYI